MKWANFFLAEEFVHAPVTNSQMSKNKLLPTVSGSRFFTLLLFVVITIYGHRSNPAEIIRVVADFDTRFHVSRVHVTVVCLPRTAGTLCVLGLQE